MRHLRSFLLALLLIVLAVSPSAARPATPAASPAASPVSGGAWRVAKDRFLTLDGKASSLSPDGKWIAGPGADADTFCVWATRTGKGRCQGPVHAIRPETITWAPDSSAVAFSLNAVQFFVDSDIYVFEIKEQKLHDITDDGIVKADLLHPATLTKPVPIDDVPAWSPDGTQLAFVRTNWGKDSHPTELMRIKRTGGTPTLIRTIDRQAPFAIYEPMKWLPDNRILFTIALADLKSTRNGLWRVGLDGKGLKLLLAGDSTAQIPALWLQAISPDGKFASVYSPLILGQFSGRKPAFFLVDLESFNAVPFKTRLGQLATPPLFSPDGRALLYVTVEGEAMHLVVQGFASGKETILVKDLNQGGKNAQHIDRSEGVAWATDNTVLIETFAGARLLTLADQG